MKSVIDLMKLVFLIAVVCHVFSLFWYGLAIMEINYGRNDTWLNAKHLVDESTWVKYVYSFYFLSVTMITVGYGDITPQNYIEAIFTILIMFTTAIFWAFFLGKVGKIIDTLAKQDKLFNKNMGIIHQMMREERVDISLRIKISNYLSYFYKNYKFCNISCQICQNYQHLPQNCPKTHFVLSKQAHICRYNQSQNHLERQQFKRKNFKFQSLSQAKSCFQAIFSINDNESLFEYLDNIENLIQTYDNLALSDQEQEIPYNQEKEDKEEINDCKKKLNKLIGSSKQSLFTKMTNQDTLENFQAQQTYQLSHLSSQQSSFQDQGEQQNEQEDDDQSQSVLNQSQSLNNQINLQQKLNSEPLTQLSNQKAQQNQKKTSFLTNNLNMQANSNLQMFEGESIFQDNNQKNIRQLSPQSEQGNQVNSDYILNDQDIKSQNQQFILESQNSIKSKFPSRLIQNNTERKQTSFTSFKEQPYNLTQKRQSLQESLRSKSSSNGNDISQQLMSPQQEKELQGYKNHNYQHLHQYSNKSKLKQNVHQNPLSLHKIQNKHISSSYLQCASQNEILNNSKINPQSFSSLPQQIQHLKQKQQQLVSEMSQQPYQSCQTIKIYSNDREQLLIDQLNDEQLMFIQKQKYGTNVTEYENNYFILQFFEKAYIFKFYNPQSNYDKIIIKHQKIMQNIIKNRINSAYFTLLNFNKKVEQKVLNKSNFKYIMMNQQTQENNRSEDSHQRQINFDADSHLELSKFPMKREDSLNTIFLDIVDETEEKQKQNLKNSIDSLQINLDILNSTEQKRQSIRSQSRNMLTPFQIRKRSQQIKYSIDEGSTSSAQTPNSKERKLSSFTRKSKMLSIVNLFLNVKLFIDTLQINLRVLSKLTQSQHDTINDISSTFGNSKQKQQFFQKYKIDVLSSKIFKFLPNIPVFSPYSIQKRIWDYIQVLIIFVLFYLISLSLFFDLSIKYIILDFYKLCLSMFIIDMLTTFNTGVIQKGSVNYNRIGIAITYIQKYLLSDILGNLSLMIFIPLHQSDPEKYKFIQILIFTKWVRIRDIFQRLSFYLCYETNQKNTLDIIRLFFLLIGVCHTFCCFWHGLAMYEISIGIQNTWMHHLNIINTSIMVRYTYSFYFLSVTMITVGYGDITPQNPIEIVFTIATMFVTGIVYAFCLNTIGFIIDDIEKKNKKYKENMQAIHLLMREENVNNELRSKVSNYLEYLHRGQNEILQNKQKIIIEKFSQQLQRDFMIEVKGKYIKDIPFLNSLSEKNQVTLLMEEVVYSPGDYIFRQEKRDDYCLYYIVRGQVELTQTQFKDKEIVLMTKCRQEYFGEVSFITGCLRQHSAKAVDFCRVYRINRQQFINAIKQDDHDYELFQMLKDTVIFQKEYHYCSQLCKTCNQRGHYKTYCPKTHLIFNRQILAARQLYSEPHTKRTNINRKNANKQKSLFLLSQLQQAYQKINENQEYFDALDEIERGLNLFEEMYSYEINDQYLECINEEDENMYSESQLQQKFLKSNYSIGSQKRGQKNLNIFNQDSAQKQNQQQQQQGNFPCSLQEFEAYENLINNKINSSSSSNSFQSSQTSCSNPINKSIIMSPKKLQDKSKSLSEEYQINKIPSYLKQKTSQNKIKQDDIGKIVRTETNQIQTKNVNFIEQPNKKNASNQPENLNQNSQNIQQGSVQGQYFFRNSSQTDIEKTSRLQTNHNDYYEGDQAQDLMSVGFSKSSLQVYKDKMLQSTNLVDNQEIMEDTISQILIMFDKPHIFQHYFPQYNFPIILEKRHKFLIKKLEKKRRDKKQSIQKKSISQKQKFFFSSYICNQS
ncbi:hypothetical protein ABPG74_022585 [Tetrahymena malaccensis]